MEGIFYTGVINLSKIPKELIKKNRNGESIIYADFSERRSPSLYGDTHYLKVYDSTNRQQIYIGDFRPSNFNRTAPEAPAAAAAPAPAPSPAPMPSPASDPNSLELQEGDLPWD